MAGHVWLRTTRQTGCSATELLTSGTYDSVAGGIAYDTMNDAVTAAP